MRGVRPCQWNPLFQQLLLPANAIEGATNGYNATAALQVTATCELRSSGPRGPRDRRTKRVPEAVFLVCAIEGLAVQAYPDSSTLMYVASFLLLARVSMHFPSPLGTSSGDVVETAAVAAPSTVRAIEAAKCLIWFSQSTQRPKQEA